MVNEKYNLKEIIQGSFYLLTRRGIEFFIGTVVGGVITIVVGSVAFSLQFAPIVNAVVENDRLQDKEIQVIKDSLVRFPGVIETLENTVNDLKELKNILILKNK